MNLQLKPRLRTRRTLRRAFESLILLLLRLP